LAWVFEWIVELRDNLLDDSSHVAHICHLKLLEVLLQIKMLKSFRLADDLLAHAILFGLFNFSAVIFGKSISCNFHSKLIVLVVNPGLVENIELVDVVCRPIVFLGNSYFDEWH